MHYAKTARGVRYGGNAVRGADGASFEALLEPWARDRSAVYFEGRKVGRANPDSFRVLSGRVGCDAQRIFWSGARGNLMGQGLSTADGFHRERAKVIENEGALFLVSDRAWLLGNIVVGLRLDPGSFEPLGRGYCRDAQRVVWLTPDERVQSVPDADPATLTVDADGVRDRNGSFVAGVRDTGPLPVQREPDLSAAAARLVQGFWQELLPIWFERFDRAVVAHGTLSQVGQPADAPTQVPAHRLRLQGAGLRLEARGLACDGTVSGMELLAGWLYGVARAKRLGDEVCVRVLLRTDGDIVAREGSPPRWQRCIDLAYLFETLGHHKEALFLVQRALRWHPNDRATTVEDGVRARIDKLVGALAAEIPRDVRPQGSTTQAAMAWIVGRAMHRASDPLVRRDMAGYIAEIAGETRIARARLASLAEPAMSLLEDPEPAVRAEAAASFDFLCGQALDFADYEVALPYARALAAGRFNLDLQHARLWACFSALGRDEEAERAWTECLRFEAFAPSPVRRLIEQRAYPSTMEEWRAFEELRVVEAHRAAARGTHPSEEMRKKKRPLSVPARTPADWSARRAALGVHRSNGDHLGEGPASGG
jgi:hypothetical protein